MILASKSPYRKKMLEDAGLRFTCQPASIDERAIEDALEPGELSGEDIAQILALAKATDVSNANPDTMVIGSDQTLSLDDTLLHKPDDMDGALRRLLQLSGKTHQLNTAVTLVRNGEMIWQYCDVARIKFRILEPDFVGRYLAKVGDVALTSVGAYQIEGLGVQLMEDIQGDFFTIMGLPLLPLMKKLRDLDLVD